MTTLTFLPDRNARNKDFTGAFLPESRLWIEKQGGESKQICLADIPEVRRRTQLSAISYHRPSVIAWFTHGLPRALPQMGWMVQNVQRLADEITLWSTAPKIVLYACSTGAGPNIAGDGGFADTLRDALCRAGAIWCQVDAHTTAGHAGKNPHVRRFLGVGSSEGGKGGEWIVPPGDPAFRAWQKALQGPLRFEFPFQSIASIRDTFGVK